ncbi:MAG: hypothetical protein ACPG4K_04675, partial [Haloferula sp.]
MDIHLRKFLLLAAVVSIGTASRVEAAAPTLSSIDLITGATEDQTIAISHATLLNSDVADSDTALAAIEFVVQGAPNGTLEDPSGDPIGDGDTISFGEIWSWTPPEDENGALVAFKVRAFDGDDESAEDVNVNVDVDAVNDPPAFDPNPLVITGAIEDKVFTFDHSDLVAAVVDPDHVDNDIRFTWVQDLSGTSTRSGSGLGGSTLRNGESWQWQADANAFGELSGIEIRASDGDDSSVGTLTVKFQVAPVNDPPIFVPGGGVAVQEDAAPQSIQWATGIQVGPANESADQSIQEFTIASGYDQNLFSVQPSISPTGLLTFTPAADEWGTVALTVNLVDDGGTTNPDDDDTGPNTPLLITISSVEDDPVLGGTLGDAGTVGATQINPLSDASLSGNPEGSSGNVYNVFEALTVSDRDQGKPTAAPVTESLDVSVVLPADIEDYGQFVFPQYGGSNWSETGTTYELTGLTPSQVEAALDAVTFTPDSNFKPVLVYELGVTVTVTDQTPGTTAAASSAGTTGDSLWLESVNDPPEVTATLSPDSIPDYGAASPFRLTIIDPDPGDTFSVSVSETSAPAKGVLTLPASPMTGDAAAIDSAVRSVVFTPNAQNSVVSANFQFDVVDVHPAPNTNTPPETGTSAISSLTITFDNDAPQLSGVTTELIRITDDPGEHQEGNRTKPFFTASVSDADPGQVLTVMVTLDDVAKGSLGPSTVFDMGFPGRITGTASQVTEKLRMIEFVPTVGRSATGDSETVVLTVSIDDGYSTPLVNSATRIEVTAVNGAP